MKLEILDSFDGVVMKDVDGDVFFVTLKSKDSNENVEYILPKHRLIENKITEVGMTFKLNEVKITDRKSVIYGEQYILTCKVERPVIQIQFDLAFKKIWKRPVN